MVTRDTWFRFVDDASPLEDASPRRASPSRGDRTIKDDDLPRLGAYRGDIRLVITGGAGQIAGPTAYCRQHHLEVVALDCTVRDLDDPAGNLRRLVAAVDAALAAGDLLEDTVVHVRVRGALSSAWLAALDVISEVGWVVALPLDDADLDPEPWIDAAMDRDTEVSFVRGSVEQAVAGLQTAARLWGDESDLTRARRFVRSWATAEPDVALDHLQSL